MSRNTENPTLLWGFAFRYPFHGTPKVVRRTPKIQGVYGDSHFGKTPKVGSQDTENPTRLWGFAFRYPFHETPKVVRRTPKFQRTYGISHFGILFTEHRRSVVKRRKPDVPMVFRISASVSQDTERCGAAFKFEASYWAHSFRSCDRLVSPCLFVLGRVSALSSSSLGDQCICMFQVGINFRSGHEG